MRLRGRKRAVLILVVAGMLVLGLPAAMASATETNGMSAPSDLRQAGFDEFGTPLLKWDGSGNTGYGYYEVQYTPQDGQSFGATGSGPKSAAEAYETGNDWWGYCLEGGDYAVQVRFVTSSGLRSAWSNAIQAEIPELF
jgi:hypothetical protein